MKSSLELVVAGGTCEEQKLARRVVRWFEKQELDGSQRTGLYVSVVKSIDEAGSVEERFPYGQSESANSRRYFVMYLSAAYRTTEDYVVTLMHELVHVQQMMQRRLEWSEETSYRALWKGRDYTESFYSQQPWEREAYRREWPLTQQYCLDVEHEIPILGVCLCGGVNRNRCR